MSRPGTACSDVRDAIFAVTRDILSMSALQQKLLDQGLSVMIETPDEFGARIRRETALWAGVINSRHITLQ
jgi:hypothetical protein